MTRICSLALCLAIAIAIQLSTAVEDDVHCVRHDGKGGYCKLPRDCPQILAIMNERKRSNGYTPEQLRYLINSGNICAKGLCCEYEVNNGIQELQHQECGRFSVNKVIGGKEIVIMSRPWMALFGYNASFGTVFDCAGTLIHKRFVLTAAHCVADNVRMLVRLGEHQISTEQDCRVVRGGRTCAPPVEDIDIEEIFIHEQYSNITKFNDIAIVKLSRDVEFKKHIKPICLPLTEALQRETNEIESFMVTGWGMLDNVTLSDVPMEAEVPRRNRRICRNALRREVNFNQLCVGEKGVDSCSGDSGGPLLVVQFYEQLQRFVQYGIVSYGPTNCGGDYPAVYTSVSSFIPWIAHKVGTK